MWVPQIMGHPVQKNAHRAFVGTDTAIFDFFRNPFCVFELIVLL